MSFSFDPLFWFVCRSCREAFPSTDKLKEHKLKNHLGDCLEIKCIIFEETCIEEHWIPPNLESSSYRTTSTNSKCFKNPYVSLTRLNPHELDSAINRNRSDHEIERTGNWKGYTRNKNQRKCSECINIKDEQNQLFNQNEFEESNEITLDEDIQQILKPENIMKYCTEEVTIEFAQELVTSNMPESTFITASIPNMNVDVDRDIDLSHDFQFDQTQERDPTFFIPNTEILTKFQPQDSSFSETSEREVEFTLPRIEMTDTTADNDDSDFLTSSYSGPNIPDDNHVIKFELSDTNPIEPESILPFISPILQEVSTSQPVKFAFKPIPSSYSSSNLPEDDKDIEFECSNTDPVETESTPSLISPISQEVSVSNSFMCTVCFALFLSKRKLHSHMNSHSEDRPFKCPYCSAAFKYKHCVKRHLVTHGINRSHQCRICGKLCLTNKTLLDHERIHTGDRPFKCHVPSCTKNFASNRDLTYHTRLVHFEELGLQQFVCHICGKSYGLQSRRKRHIRESHKQ